MENEKTKLGVTLIVGYTWLGAIVFAFLGSIILLSVLQDPGANGIGIALFALFLSFSFAYILGKLANMTYRLESKAWWGQMILSAFGLLVYNPISLIIMIYLWVNKKLFEIGE